MREPSFLNLNNSFSDTFKCVRNFIVMDDGKAVEIPKDPRFLHYEDLMAAAKPIPFVECDERMAAGMCYTSVSRDA